MVRWISRTLVRDSGEPHGTVVWQTLTLDTLESPPTPQNGTPPPPFRGSSAYPVAVLLEDFVPESPQHDYAPQGAVHTVKGRLHDADQGLDKGLHSMSSVVGQGELGVLGEEGGGREGREGRN